MKACGIIKKDILDMNILEFDIAINDILNNNGFLVKDNTGNRMYSRALKYYRCFFSCQETDIKEDDVIKTAINDFASVSDTERKSLVKSRIGQGVFRDRILNKYGRKCLITGLMIDKCLIASHIKPWAVCNNNERLSEENGLLLSATYDRLFDSGLISFQNTGQIIISDFINETNKHILNLTPDISIKFTAGIEMSNNLEYHRDIVFIK